MNNASLDALDATVAGVPWLHAWMVAATVAVVLLAALTVLRARRRSAASARQDEAEARHAADVAAYRTAATDWQRRRDELGTLLAAAQDGYAGQVAGVTLRSGEKAFCDLPANLLEQTSEGLAEVEPGRLVVTDRRVVFVGARTRTWSLRSLPQVRHLGQDRTLVKGMRDEDWAGVSYVEAPVARLYLELALAGSHHARVSFLRNVVQGLNDNEMRRPEAPVPPAPVTGLGRRARANAAAWHGERLAETEQLRSLTAQPVVLMPTQRMSFLREQLPTLADEPVVPIAS